MTAPILVFGWGNPSRGDDALGPLFVERIEALKLPHVECLTDFQLQVEHALDLQGRQRVLFVDASVGAATPFEVGEIQPMPDASFTTHALSPQAVMQVHVDLNDEPPPPCWLLAIRGDKFDLGTPLGEEASAHLDAAILWARAWLQAGAPGAAPCRERSR
ncbi:MAG: hydrogenase maturation protease [Rhodocyclaceae bacterium]|nr:hydrogenase maturation protease [Rhodocyclaceae bacterium]